MTKLKCTITFTMDIDDSGLISGEQYTAEKFAGDIVRDIEEGWSEAGEEIECVHHQSGKSLIEQAKELGWKWTVIELVDAGQAYGYESPDKSRFLTAKQLIEEMRGVGHVDKEDKP